jgi:pimeloyl-ACP methyl ester carboxylesterase
MSISAIDKKSLLCLDEGEGEAVILLYGLFGSAKNFETLISRLRLTHRVIVPYFPFDEPTLCANIFSLTSFLHQVVEELQLEKFHLLGNSMGGHIALLYVLKYPDKVESLILSGSSGLYENGIGDSYPRRRDYDYIRSKTRLTFYNPDIASPELVDEIYAVVNSRRILQIISLAKSTIRHNVEKELGTIKVPCCLIWGCNDTITPPHIARDFQRLIPQTELHWIDYCGHVPMLERPDEYYELLYRFLVRAKK